MSSHDLPAPHSHHLAPDLTAALPGVLDDLTPSHHHSGQNPATSLSDIPPLLHLPSSYSNRLRQDHAAHNFVCDSHMIISESMHPGTAAEHESHHAMGDDSESEFPMISHPTKTQVPSSCFSFHTGETLPDLAYTSLSDYVHHKQEQPQQPQHPQPQQRDADINDLVNALQGQAPSLSPSPSPPAQPRSQHPQLEGSAQLLTNPNLASMRSDSPALSDDGSDDMITPMQSPATLQVASPSTCSIGRVFKKPRKPRKLRIYCPPDMDIEAVRKGAQEGRDKAARELEAQYGPPDVNEAHLKFSGIFERARSRTEWEKIAQRERKRGNQPTAKGASRLEAALSRYTKDVLIQTLLEELKVLTRDNCILQKGLNSKCTKSCECPCNCGPKDKTV